MAFADGEEERREPGGKTRVHVRPGADQRLHDRRVPFGGRPHQRGLSARFVLGVNPGTGREQSFGDRQSAGPRRSHQRCLAAGKRRVGIGARLQQQVDDRGIAIGAGQGQRRDAVATGRVRVGAGFHQQLGHFAIVVIRGPVQRGHAIDLRRVHIGALLDQRPDRRTVHLLGRIGERGSGARVEGRHGQQAKPATADCQHFVRWGDQHRPPGRALEALRMHNQTQHPLTATATHRSCPCCRRTHPCARRRVRAA